MCVCMIFKNNCGINNATRQVLVYIYLKSTVETSCSGVISVNNFQTGLSSIRAHRSHKAFTIAAVAKCTTPHSAPS